jgi:hypothetical protein
MSERRTFDKNHGAHQVEALSYTPRRTAETGRVKELAEGERS